MIENEIFKKCSVNYDKLKKYGFIKNNDIYIYEKKFLNNEFMAIIKINNGNISGKVIDLQVNEEYININTNMQGEFVNKVRDEYKNILLDIRNNCFISNNFIYDQTNRINKYIKDKYNDEPEFLWSKFPGYAVFRNKYNNKWYGIIMNIDLSKISNDHENVEIINIKLDKDKINDLLNKKGFYKAYHMNKEDWITISLNDTLSDEYIIDLLDESYDLVNEPEEWIVPANPNYYDIVNCFNDSYEIIWKQSSNIHVSDIVYIYVGEPYSKIMYKCIVTSTNIPYKYKDKNVEMNRVMKIKLIKKLDNENYNLDYLKSIGIKTIRGPRKINKNIRDKLKKTYNLR